MLTLTNVFKSFGRIVAVDDLSLAIAPGEFFGMLGPNGAGKTTTIAMAVGLLEPDRGTVDFNNSGTPTRPHVRAQLGVAPQSLALYGDFTGRENLDFFARLHHLDRRARHARVEKLLERVGLRDRATDYVRHYSGGMKRRLNLAAAIIHDPRLVLLDEPTVGVDPQSRTAIFELLRELHADGRTVVYTTHYMEEAQRLCDRVAIMDHGRLLALDSVNGLIDAHGGDSVVTIERKQGDERISTTKPLEVVSQRVSDPAVMNLHIERPNLETVFLNLTGRSLRD